MALSMDEQRMLAEIERRLAAEDPGLASCLTTFRRPGPATVLRSPRARIIGSLFTVLLVAMVSLMVYAMIPFRTHPVRSVTPSAGPPGNTAISATKTSSQPPGTQQASASVSAGVRSSAGASAPNQSAVRASGTATNRAQGAKTKQTSAAASPAAKP